MKDLEQTLNETFVNVFIHEELIDNVAQIDQQLHDLGIKNTHIMTAYQNSKFELVLNSISTNELIHENGFNETFFKTSQLGIIITKPTEKSFVDNFGFAAKHMTKAVFENSKVLMYDFKFIYQNGNQEQIAIDHNLQLSLII